MSTWAPLAGAQPLPLTPRTRTERVSGSPSRAALEVGSLRTSLRFSFSSTKYGPSVSSVVRTQLGTAACPACAAATAVLATTGVAPPAAPAAAGLAAGAVVAAPVALAAGAAVGDTLPPQAATRMAAGRMVAPCTNVRRVAERSKLSSCRGHWGAAAARRVPGRWSAARAAPVRPIVRRPNGIRPVSASRSAALAPSPCAPTRPSSPTITARGPTSSTGVAARSIVSAATLPSTRRSSPVRPCVASAIRSTRPARRTSAIVPTGRPLDAGRSRGSPTRAAARPSGRGTAGRRRRVLAVAPGRPDWPLAANPIAERRRHQHLQQDDLGLGRVAEHGQLREDALGRRRLVEPDQDASAPAPGGVDRHPGGTSRIGVGRPASPPRPRCRRAMRPRPPRPCVDIATRSAEPPRAGSARRPSPARPASRPRRPCARSPAAVALSSASASQPRRPLVGDREPDAGAAVGQAEAAANDARTRRSAAPVRRATRPRAGAPGRRARIRPAARSASARFAPPSATLGRPAGSPAFPRSPPPPGGNTRRTG